MVKCGEVKCGGVVWWGSVVKCGEAKCGGEVSLSEVW